MIAHLNIGSNSGDSLALVRQAVAAISLEFPSAGICVSEPYRSAPWGYESPNEFVNLAVAIEMPPTEPLELLHRLQKIERGINTTPHRNPDGTYRDRELDIDLIAIDQIVLESEELTLPHPRMHLRPFVLQPMAETAPAWRHPHLHLTPAELLEKIQ